MEWELNSTLPCLHRLLLLLLAGVRDVMVDQPTARPQLKGRRGNDLGPECRGPVATGIERLGLAHVSAILYYVRSRMRHPPYTCV